MQSRFVYISNGNPFRLAPTLSLMILFRFSHNQMTSYKFKLKLNNNIKHDLIFNHNARHHTATWLFIREFCHGALTSSLHSCVSKAAIKHEHYINWLRNKTKSQAATAASEHFNWSRTDVILAC